MHQEVEHNFISQKALTCVLICCKKWKASVSFSLAPLFVLPDIILQMDL